MAISRSGIDERQKDVQISHEEWSDNWELAFKRSEKNTKVMKRKRKPKNNE